MARVVSAGKRVVGFLMYDVQKTKGKAQKFSIYRFMINRKHQGKGYGRATLNKALEEIQISPGQARYRSATRQKNRLEVILRQLRLRGGGAGPRW